MTDPVAALAAVMARLNPFIGQQATFLTPTGVRITGTLSSYDLRENHGNGQVWVTFRECDDEYQVVGFPEAPKALPGERQQIEEGPQ